MHIVCEAARIKDSGVSHYRFINVAHVNSLHARIKIDSRPSAADAQTLVPELRYTHHEVLARNVKSGSKRVELGGWNIIGIHDLDIHIRCRHDDTRDLVK